MQRLMQANGNTHAVTFAFLGASHVSTLCGRLRSMRNAYLKGDGPISCPRCAVIKEAHDRAAQRQLSLFGDALERLANERNA
jgi:hypothetical protein